MPDLISLPRQVVSRGHPVYFWIPASAGMTTVGYLTAGVIPESILLKKKQLFSKVHLHVVNESVAMAEELVSEYYKMSASEWLRP